MVWVQLNSEKYRARWRNGTARVNTYSLANIAGKYVWLDENGVWWDLVGGGSGMVMRKIGTAEMFACEER
jgi:hypothetical protein